MLSVARKGLSVTDNRLSIADIKPRISALSHTKIHCPRDRNKGVVGLLIETMVDIPHGPNRLDCSDGELKCYPLTTSHGKVVPKETMAITMLNPDDLRNNEFDSSHVVEKMSTMLIVAYYRHGDAVEFKDTYTFRLSDHPEIAQIIKEDYDTIRAQFLADGTLTSRTGTLLQNRPKGAGHGSTSRAFYLRKEFMMRVMPIHYS